ncbi:hypothetical protein GVI59_13770 [Acetobacter sicerae]|nr:hypothetical protein [Acetobacter sicerae]
MDLAILFFDYKSHLYIDRKFELIRRWQTTAVAASDEPRLRDRSNTTSVVWAHTAYRSKTNAAFMEKQGLISKGQRKKPHRQPIPQHVQRSNAGKSIIRSRAEHVRC